MAVEKQAIPVRWTVLLGMALLLCSQGVQIAQAQIAQVPTPQSGIPVTAPTGMAPAAGVSPGVTPVGPQAGLKPAHRAEVTYGGGKITIAADDSSLNQILREIQRKTGMKITGGVAEERVYGTYGPGSLAEVLAGLLDGAGSNMMLVGAEPGAPAELILTPRQGNATPPSPSALAGDDPEERPQFVPQPTRQPVVVPVMPPDLGAATPAPVPNGAPAGADGAVAASVTAAQAADPALTPPQIVPAADNSSTGSGTGSNGSAAANAPDAGNPQSPNGVKTPDQIFQQLLQMQQQQKQQQANPK